MGKNTITTLPTSTNITNTTISPKTWRWLPAPLVSLVGFFHVTPVPPEEIQTILKSSRAANAAADKSMEESERLTREIDEALRLSAQTRR